MADLDTRDKRASGLRFGKPYAAILVRPTGTIGPEQRQALCWLYEGLLAAGAIIDHATAGVLTGAGAAIVGAAAHIAKHATTGVLAGAGAVIIGSAAHIATHPTSGVLTGPGASLVGAAARSGLGGITHDTTGILIGPGAHLVGYVSVGLVYAIAQQARVSFEIKRLADTKQLVFDFISQMRTGEVLVSAVNTITVYSGNDPYGGLNFLSTATVAGSQATQLITGGVAGCIYRVDSRGLTSYNRQTFLTSFLVVL